MPVTFNTQVGATTQSQIGFGGQAEGVQAAAKSGTALRLARYKEQKEQSRKSLAQQQEQFDTRLGMEREQFNKSLAMKKKAEKYGKKKAEGAERISRIGTSVTIGKLGLEMANEFDLDLASNLGFGEESIDAPGSDVGPVEGASMKAIKPETYGDSGVDISEPTAGARGKDFSPGGEFSGTEAGSGQSQSWWSQHGGTVMGGVAGGVTGGLMGSQLSMSLFGEGKTQSMAGGMAGGALGGYAGTGAWQGGLGGLAIGGIMGYLLG
jgi:hypothetical protein